MRFGFGLGSRCEDLGVRIVSLGCNLGLGFRGDALLAHHPQKHDHDFWE